MFREIDNERNSIIINSTLFFLAILITNAMLGVKF